MKSIPILSPLAKNLNKMIHHDRLSTINVFFLIFNVQKEDLGSLGNILLYRMAGSRICLVPGKDYESLKRRIEKMSQFIR